MDKIIKYLSGLWHRISNGVFVQVFLMEFLFWPIGCSIWYRYFRHTDKRRLTWHYRNCLFAGIFGAALAIIGYVKTDIAIILIGAICYLVGFCMYYFTIDNLRCR